MLTLDKSIKDDRCLYKAFLPELEGYYAGKVRDNYSLGEERVMIATDRISCFDHLLPDTIPHKGAVLNLISAFFFAKTKNIVPNHLKEVLHPNVMLACEARPIPVEFIVRGYITGSAWAKYERGERYICGVELPDGLTKNERLKSPVLTPTLKVRDGHDEDTTKERITGEKILTKERFEEIERICLKLYLEGDRLCREKGLLLVDTKYELGYLDGELILIDEIHTPDSSRFWDEVDYEDAMKSGRDPGDISKEKVRKFLKAGGFEGRPGEKIPRLTSELVQEVSAIYRGLYERITGLTYIAEEDEPGQSIVRELRRKGILGGSFVPIILGSQQDMPFAEKIMNETKRLGFPGALHIASAHKQPVEVLTLLETYDMSIEPLVFITIAGRSNALSGMVAANTRFPVIACPPFKDQNDYLVNIHSTLQMPSHVPLMTVIDPMNAALACARILSLVCDGKSR